MAALSSVPQFPYVLDCAFNCETLHPSSLGRFCQSIYHSNRNETETRPMEGQTQKMKGEAPAAARNLKKHKDHYSFHLTV